MLQTQGAWRQQGHRGGAAAEVQVFAQLHGISLEILCKQIMSTNITNDVYSI